MMNPLLSAALLFVPFMPKIIDYLKDQDKGQVAEKTLSIARDVTGCDCPESALQKMMEEPQLQESFVKEMTAFLLSLEETRMRNIQDARLRDMVLASMGSARRGDLMVVLAALGLIVSLVALTFFKDMLSGEATGIISTIAGIFGSCLKDAFGFEFGSSRGSREKDFFYYKERA
jgi:uncharacterized protein YacL